MWPDCLRFLVFNLECPWSRQVALCTHALSLIEAVCLHSTRHTQQQYAQLNQWQGKTSRPKFTDPVTQVCKQVLEISESGALFQEHKNGNGYIRNYRLSGPAPGHRSAVSSSKPHIYSLKTKWTLYNFEHGTAPITTPKRKRATHTHTYCPNPSIPSYASTRPC